MSKYGNKLTNGYHSKKEAKRALELRLLMQSGEITELRELLSPRLAQRYWAISRGWRLYDGQ